MGGLDGFDRELTDTLGGSRSDDTIDGGYVVVVVGPGDLNREIPFGDGARDGRETLRVDRIVGELERGYFWRD